MVRISVVEQYDNKDVVQQVYSLKGRQNTLEETQASFEATVQEASSNASNALQLATSASDGVNALNPRVDSLETDVDVLESRVPDVDVSVTTGSIVTTATTAQLQLTRNNGSLNTTDIPLASGSVTGMMTAQTYNGLTNLQARVNALEASQTVYYVTFASSNPNQVEITTAFATAAGRQPEAGDYCTDIAKSLTYGYDGTTWIQVQQSPIPIFSNSSAGIIMGDASEPGTIFAEADGTGSVNGWDTLNQSVQSNTASIGTSSDSPSATGSLYARISNNSNLIATNTASIQQKQDTITAVTVTLTASAWSSNTQTVNASNVTSDNIVWVSPSVSSFDAYGEAGIRATAQGDGTITFTCSIAPVDDMTVEVVA